MAVLRDRREVQRLCCLESYKSGWPQKDIANALGVSEGAISQCTSMCMQWVKIFEDVPEAERADALGFRKTTGRTPSIKAEDRPKIVALVHAGADSIQKPAVKATQQDVAAVARFRLPR